MRDRFHALRRGAVATFLAHVVVTTLAAVVAWPLAGLLLRSGATDATDLTSLVDALWSGAHGIVTAVDVLLVVLAVTAVVAPLIELAWLASLAKRQPPADALALGAKRYFAAWRITLLLAPGFGVALLLLVVGPLAASALAESVVNERTHDLLVLAAMLPALAVGLLFLVWHDLARAALATSSRSAVGAVLRTARLALRGPAALVYLATGALALALGVIGHLAGAALDHGIGAAVVVLATTQSIALARTFCRAYWLSDTVVRVTA